MHAPTSRHTKLYSPRLLGLSTQLANFPLVDGMTHLGGARSRTCGSSIELGFDLDEDGRVTRVGCGVTACAVGQSSAAVMAEGAGGRTAVEIIAMAQMVETWLAGRSGPPGWPQFDALEPALAHPGRHGALAMPWNAAVGALSPKAVAR